MKKYIRTTLLIVAIYSGAIAANSDDADIGAAAVFSLASLGFVMTTDDKN